MDGGACEIGVESTIVDCTATPPRVLRLGAISQEQVDEVLGSPGGARADGGPQRDAPPARGGSSGAAGAVPDGAGDPGVAGRVGIGEGVGVRAPGTLESHYAPAAEVLLIEPSHASAADLAAVVEHGVERPAGEPEPDPFRLAPLEGSQPAPIAGDGHAWASRVGLVGELGVVTPPGWTRLAAPANAEQYARDLYAALRRADELHLDVVVAVLPEASGGPLALAVRDRLARAAHPDRT